MSHSSIYRRIAPIIVQAFAEVLLGSLGIDDLADAAEWVFERHFQIVGPQIEHVG